MRDKFTRMRDKFTRVREGTVGQKWTGKHAIAWILWKYCNRPSAWGGCR